ncbi:phage portal protein [Pseudomonas sp. G.S.17]|uniref:phage portal protein n=1 Tax=Pseudomonas sp. G.S.17 TaxID=3137451 RepID=UPI00311CAA32
MNIRELEAQAKALAPVLRGFVDKALSAFRSDLKKDLDARDESLRSAVSKSLEGVLTDIDEVARAASALIEKPKDGEPGKDADPEYVRQLVEAAVAELPAPKDGKSVTVEDVLPGITDALEKAIADLPAAKDGESVTAEEVQALVDDAVSKCMQAMSLPKDGEPGRDAAHIEILPAVDIAKCYPRGTYAKHLGGLWRSYEATVGLKGWECIVEGVASIGIEQSGDRSFKAVATLSSGRTEEKSLTFPLMIYRGVFGGGDHAPGDTVTWAGSLWHCDEPTSDKPGETGSKGWRLAVKKGRDGKDGINGKDLTKGVSIK